ncbi:MAG: FAD-binding oxidoreductase [Gemmatimonadota bacterium]
MPLSDAILSSDPAVRQAFSADASGLVMVPDAVARPTTAAEVVDLLQQSTAHSQCVTSAGGQSSMTAAAITDRGVLLSLRGLDRITVVDAGAGFVRVGPGMGVAQLKRTLAEQGLLFAPDPTSEEEASLGGAIACNASGARSLRYGATRPHVRALSVVLADGRTVEFRRTRLEKNTVGYIPTQDPIDWFIGSEGTLGVIVEAELGLLPLPEKVTGLGIPFADERDALAFVVAARQAMDAGTMHPRCLEFLDAGALEVVRAEEGGAQWSGSALVYTEEESRGDADADFDGWLALAEQHHAQVDAVMVFDSDATIRTARRLRHAVPAVLGEYGTRHRATGGIRVGTDWAVPYARLPEAITMARGVAARHGVDNPTIFGHAGNGHPHFNFICRNPDEIEAVDRVLHETLVNVIAMGGTVAAEHGIGKIKQRWLPLQLSTLQVDAMLALKHTLDPKGLLAPGNLLP